MTNTQYERIKARIEFLESYVADLYDTVVNCEQKELYITKKVAEARAECAEHELVFLRSLIE